MQYLGYIQYGIFALAIIGIVVSVMMMSNLIPGSRIGAEDYDNPAFKAFVVSLAVLVADVAVGLGVFLWHQDVPRVLSMSVYGFIVVTGVLVMPGVRPWLRSAWQNVRGSARAATLAEVKKPWLSKTIVINALVAALLLADANISGLQGFLPASKYQIVAFLLPIVNMLLRAYTTKGLSFKPAIPQDGAVQ